MRRVIVVLIITVPVLLMACAPTTVSQSISERLYNVGFRVITFQMAVNGSIKNLDAAVWYPTAEPVRKYNYGGPAYGNVSFEAAPLNNKGAFPMLAFSHGYGGCGLASLFFTEKLAAKGWIVACPDHHDSHYAARSATGRNINIDRRGLLEGAREIVSTTPAERGRYMYRPEELETTIKGMIASPLFGRLIDTTKIAVGGHSFGGFTSTALCGSIADYHDARIKAILLFSTGAAAYLMTEAELSNVNIPSMLMMGEKEKEQKRGEKTMEELENMLFRNMKPPKYFLEIKGASHFSYNIRLSYAPGTKVLSGSKREFSVITRYSIAFLEKYVARKSGYDDILLNGDPMVTRFVREAD